MRIVVVLLAFAILGSGLFIVNFDSLVFRALESNPDKLVKIIENHYENQKLETEKQKILSLAKEPILVNTQGSPKQGNDNAKYKLVIFTDFQCVYCKKFEEILKEIKANHGDDIQIFYKNLPLPFHKEAKGAAMAALAAGEQGKFFEYAEKLFEKQRELSEETFLKIAQELGLNIQKFKLDKASSKTEESIERDLKEAKSIGLNGTPAILVNGIPVKGAYPPEYFDMVFKVIDENN